MEETKAKTAPSLQLGDRPHSDDTRQQVRDSVFAEAMRELSPVLPTLKRLISGEVGDLDAGIDEIIRCAVRALAAGSGVVVDANIAAEVKEHQDEGDALKGIKIELASLRNDFATLRADMRESTSESVTQYEIPLQEVATPRDSPRVQQDPPSSYRQEDPKNPGPSTVLGRLRQRTVGLSVITKLILTVGPPVLMYATVAFAQTATAAQNPLVSKIVEEVLQKIVWVMFAYVGMLGWFVYAHNEKIVRIGLTLDRLEAILNKQV